MFTTSGLLPNNYCIDLNYKMNELKIIIEKIRNDEALLVTDFEGTIAQINGY